MIDANGDESTADESTADEGTVDADESTMTLFAPQNIKGDIEIMMNAVDALAANRAGGYRCTRIEQLVIKYIINLVVLFSGFKNRSLSRRGRNHPRNLEMVALMTSVHPWMSAKIVLS